MTELTIAIPSKGRLKEKSEAFFADCGFTLKQDGGDRGYRATLKGLANVSVTLLSAREIAQGLIDGAFHIGVTGEDLLHDLSETPGEDARVIKRLGFGYADVVVAVPKAWLDVSTMADLAAAGALFRERHDRRMKVATKYMRLTRRFFAAQSVGDYRLVYSAGATEAAPASGSAELIVDITTTGATLEANGLKVLDDGVMLRSQASLCGSLFAPWNEETLATLQSLLSSVDARGKAGEVALLQTSIDVPDAEIAGRALIRHGQRLIECPPGDIAAHAQGLTEAGYGPVSVLRPEQVFQKSSTLFENFVAKM
ncbi:MAG: ATP phosphoribosyltransferase [Pseudomonadota bacterium]